MTFPLAQTKFKSFDGGISIISNSYRPDRFRFFDQQPRQFSIPRGAGLSYVAATFGEKVNTIDLRSFNRFLSFSDPFLEVEAGATLGEVYRFLLAKRRYLPIQPGHPNITIGGCVAADVHGKNQLKDGTFSSLVEEIQLHHPDHGMLKLSRSENSSLFDLTCGGYGLTGTILTVRLKTKPLPSSSVKTRTIPVFDISMLESELTKHAFENDLVYSWHNFTAKGNDFGRGFIKTASFDFIDQAENPQESKRTVHTSLSANNRGDWKFSYFSFPRAARILNRTFYEINYIGTQPRSLPLYDFLFPVHNKEAYFKLFGHAGFHECQFIIPTGGFSEWLKQVKLWLSKKPIPVTLASAKLFSGSPTLLRFTGTGICIALDFPRSIDSLKFVHFLHQLAIETRSLPNIIKDSALSAEIVSSTYQFYEEFKTTLRIFDPVRLFQSELSQRLGL